MATRSRSPYNALQTIEYVMYVYGLRLFYLETKNLHLVTIFYHLVAKWRLEIFFTVRLLELGQLE